MATNSTKKVNTKRNKKKSNSGSIFTIVALVLLSIVGIVAIVFLSKDLLSGDGVTETTVAFTANVETKDVKWPTNVEISASEFVNNIDEIKGLTCEFETAPNITTAGVVSVKIIVKTEDGAQKTFEAKLELYEDTEAPVIEGVINRHFNIGDNITYLKGITATDALEGEVEVSVDNSQIQFDERGTALVGDYLVTYTAVDKSGNTATATAIYYFEENGINDEMIDEAIANVLAEIIEDDMTLEQKANAIYLYTYDNIAYTGNSDKDDYRKEAYNGITKLQGDCYTYFAVAKALLNEVGASTIDVERAPGVRNDHHYWLLVDLGTGYYHFDATRRAYWFNGFMATDAQVNAYSTNVVNGFYYFDTTLYPATPTEEFTFEQYTGSN